MMTLAEDDDLFPADSNLFGSPIPRELKLDIHNDTQTMEKTQRHCAAQLSSLHHQLLASAPPNTDGPSLKATLKQRA